MFEFPNKMARVFRDPEMQTTFEEQGFVRVPFYTPREIRQLADLYLELHPKDEPGFFPSTFSRDKNYRNTADRVIREVGRRTMDALLIDHQEVCGSFIVKAPGPDSIMNVHQDMTLVDESRFTGINIWCPLTDLTESNGALWILPGSHRLFPTYRGASVPDIYEGVKPEIIERMQPLYLPAGEAVIFDQSILHYSPPNESEKARIVTNIFFTHKDAEFRIAWHDPDKHTGQVELFRQDAGFMTDFEQFGENIFDRPRIGQSLGTFDYDFPRISLELLRKKYPMPETASPTRASLWDRFSKLFTNA